VPCCKSTIARMDFNVAAALCRKCLGTHTAKVHAACICVFGLGVLVRH